MFQRLFAVAVAAAAIALPSIGLAAEWRRLSEPSVGLTFEMPGEPRREVGALAQDDAQPTISYLFRDDDNRMFVVQISQAAIDLGSPQSVGDEGVDVMKNELPGLTIVSDTPGQQGPVYTRRTVGTLAGEGGAAQLTLVHDRTLVVVVYVQQTGATLSPDATRFLDSLKLAPR